MRRTLDANRPNPVLYVQSGSRQSLAPNMGGERIVATTNVAPTEVKTWLWIEELSTETGIPVRTFRHWDRIGKGGPPSFRLGRRVAYDRREVQKWIAQQRAARG